MPQHIDTIEQQALPQPLHALEEAFTAHAGNIISVTADERIGKYPNEGITGGNVIQYSHPKPDGNVGMLGFEALRTVDLDPAVYRQVEAIGVQLMKVKPDEFARFYWSVMRRQLRIFVYNALGLDMKSTEKGSASKALDMALAHLPEQQIFVEAEATAQFYDRFLSKLFGELVLSGSFIHALHLFRNNEGHIELSPAVLAANIARQNSPIASVRDLCNMMDRMATATFVGASAPKTGLSLGDAATNDQQQTERHAQRERRNSHQFQGNVLSVAEALHATNIFALADLDAHREMISPQGLGIYVTTDFANPAELIMLAAVAREAGIEGLYVSDNRAHTVGSYVERVLIPSLQAMHNLSQTQVNVLLNLAHRLRETEDISLATLAEIPAAHLIWQYLENIRQVLHIESDSFAGIYSAMNTYMAERLGLQHQEAAVFIGAFPTTVGQLGHAVDRISESINTAIDAVTTGIRQAADSTSQAERITETLFGKPPEWNRDSKVFIRSQEHGETIQQWEHEDTLLHELPDRGRTLGGNGWHLFTISQVTGRIGRQLVLVDKNTGFGANFTLPVAVHPDIPDIVAPVVRVVPAGSEATTGDGLDIGMYLAFPQLLDIVGNLFQTQDPDIVGGKMKYVVTVESSTVYLASGEQQVGIARVYKVPIQSSVLRQPVHSFYLTN